MLSLVSLKLMGQLGHSNSFKRVGGHLVLFTPGDKPFSEKVGIVGQCSLLCWRDSLQTGQCRSDGALKKHCVIMAYIFNLRRYVSNHVSPNFEYVSTTEDIIVPSCETNCTHCHRNQRG